MFPSDEIWRSVSFLLIGGIIGAVLILKTRKAEASGEKSRRPHPQEHDERS